MSFKTLENRKMIVEIDYDIYGIELEYFQQETAFESIYEGYIEWNNIPSDEEVIEVPIFRHSSFFGTLKLQKNAFPNVDIEEVVKIMSDIFDGNVFEIHLLKKEGCDCCGSVKSEYVISTTVIGYDDLKESVKEFILEYGHEIDDNITEIEVDELLKEF